MEERTFLLTSLLVSRKARNLFSMLLHAPPNGSKIELVVRRTAALLIWLLLLLATDVFGEG